MTDTRTVTREPRTEAGRRLLDFVPTGINNSEFLTQFILAIEAEAAATGGLDAIERAAQVAERHAERLKHTSHMDGLGMGWLDGEELCREIAGRIRRLSQPPTATPPAGTEPGS